MKKTIAVDLDSVLAKYKNFVGVGIIDDPIDGARWFMDKIAAMGLHVIVHTSRINPLNGDTAIAKTRVIEWLEKNKIKYGEVWCNVGKPIAWAYVDDRAILCRPQDDAYPVEEYSHTIREIDSMVKVVDKEMG